MERNIPESQIAAMPLHAITEMFGTEGLVERFEYEIGILEPAEQAKALQALELANTLHAADKRVREPYVNHLLRVSTRIMTHCGIGDGDVICAALLHDSVEDHADALAQAAGGSRVAALAELEDRFGRRVAWLVGGVTNPDFDADSDKNTQYLEHLVRLVQSDDPWLLIIKLSDFTDNATGLVYTTGQKVPKLANKYRPAIPIFRQALKRTDLPVSPDVVAHIASQLDLTEERLHTLTA